MNELEEARRTIDEVDRQMAALFEARMAAVGQVACRCWTPAGRLRC